MAIQEENLFYLCSSKYMDIFQTQSEWMVQNQ